MQPVSQAYQKEMEKPFLGAAKLRITFGITDTDAAPTCTPSDNGHEAWSDVRDAFNEEVSARTYATFEPGRMRGTAASWSGREPARAGRGPRALCRGRSPGRTAHSVNRR